MSVNITISALQSFYKTKGSISDVKRFTTCFWNKGESFPIAVFMRQKKLLLKLESKCCLLLPVNQLTIGLMEVQTQTILYQAKKDIFLIELYHTQHFTWSHLSVSDK